MTSLDKKIESGNEKKKKKKKEKEEREESKRNIISLSIIINREELEIIHFLKSIVHPEANSCHGYFHLESCLQIMDS